MAWLVIRLLLKLYGDAKQRKLRWAPFYWPTNLYQLGGKASQYCTLLLTMTGFKPGLPAQKASALSITPFPLYLFNVEASSPILNLNPWLFKTEKVTRCDSVSDETRVSAQIDLFENGLLKRVKQSRRYKPMATEKLRAKKGEPGSLTFDRKFLKQTRSGVQCFY